MDNLVVFQDQEITQGVPTDTLRLEDYEAPNLPPDFFDACFRGDSDLDFSSNFTALTSGFAAQDNLAPSQKPALMKDLSDSTSPRGVDNWNEPTHHFAGGLQLPTVVTGDTQKSGPATVPFKADNINILTGEQRAENPISSLCANRYLDHATQSTWSGAQTTSHNWHDIPNAQIEAVAGTIRNPAPALQSTSAARVTLPATGSAISKGQSGGSRGKRRKCGNSTSAKGKGSSGKSGAKKTPDVNKKAKQGKTAMETLSEEEQKRIRRVKNRVSVEKCRNKQRMRLEALQKEKETLTNENLLLRNATDTVRQSMSTVLSQVAALSGVNCRVRLA